MLHIVNKLLCVVWGAVLVMALSHRDDLPSVAELLPQVLTEPQQTQTSRTAFQVKRDDVTYDIRPLYDYDLYGLVVSKHDASSWLDSMHSYWGDFINVVDVCVVWGRNAKSGVYAKPDIEFSSGQFTCYTKIHSSQTNSLFEISALSNNHLLTDNPELVKRMREVRVGDQIHLHGHLAEYSYTNKGRSFSRGTSVSRDDVGERACETVFVDQFQVVKTGNPLWRKLFWVSILGMISSIAVWLMLPE